MIAAGSIFRRREPHGDEWDRVRVTGHFEGEVTVTSASAFTETISATPESLALAYAVESEPPAAEAWEAGPGPEVSRA